MFITFEGSEGSGKSTQAQWAYEALRAILDNVLLTREPGGTEIGEQIRRVIFPSQKTNMHLRTEILLFQASRAQLVEEIIRPHLASGGIVLCDRYGDSTLAYQGYGYRRIELAELRHPVGFATGDLKPDLTLLLDVDIEVGLRRRADCGEVNRLDGYDLPFYQRVREGFLELARQEPARWVIVDANRSPEIVQADILQIVFNKLGLQRQR